MPLTHHPLCATPLVAIADVHCLARDARCGDEEHSFVPELVFPRAGAFMRHVGRATVLGDPNHVLFFDVDETYHVSHPLTLGDSSTVLAFDPSVLDEALPRPRRPAPDRPRGARFPVSHCSIGSEVSLALGELRRYLLDRDAVEDLAIAVLHAVANRVREILDRPPRGGHRATERRRRELVEDTRLLLARSYRQATSLRAIARAVGASPFHLSRIFRDEVGLPIHRYRSLLRLKEALERLAGGERDLTRLAAELGYSSHGHFSAAFRASFGRSPSEYRLGSHGLPLEELRKILEASSAPRFVR